MDCLTGFFIPIFASVLGAILGGVGTYFGVKWTIRAESERERQNKIHLKNKLILGILHEIFLLNEFYKSTNNINQQQGSYMAIESRFIDDTVSDQLHLFDNPEIIKTLSLIRLYIQHVKGTLSTFKDLEWGEITQPYRVAIGAFGTHKNILYDMENSELKRVTTMLKLEYIGALPTNINV